MANESSARDLARHKAVPCELLCFAGLYPRSVLVNLGNITGRRYVGLDISDEVVDHLNMMRVYQNHEPDYLNMPQADDLDMLDD